MKMKRILLMLVAVTILVTSATNGIGFSAQAEDGYVATAGEQRAQKLLKIGAIYNDADAMVLTRSIKRGEFAKILIKFIGHNKMVPNQVTQKPFMDVDLDHPYIREIKQMKDLGIVTDAKLLKFRPDDYITVFEAANMLDAALGYRKLANKTYSAKLNIVDGVKKSDVAVATLDDIYVMLENCLGITIFEPELWEVANGTTKETVIERYYKLEKRRGIVTANSISGISEADKHSAKGYLEIDGVHFKSQDPEYEKYLGYTVDFYIDKSNNEIYYIIPHTTNQTLTIDSDDILPGNQNTIYYKNDKENTKKVTVRNYDVIYNKKAYSGYGNLNTVFSNIDGEITLLDRNGDKVYDVIFVDSYTYHYITAVDMQFKYIYDEETNTRIDLSDEENTLIYKADGTRIKMAGIPTDVLASVAESKNTKGDKITTVYLSDAAIEGKIDEISEEEIVINGTAYKCVDSIYNKASLGLYGNFYIGKTGKIVKFIPLAESVWNLGIVHSKDGGDGTFSNPKVRIFTSDGEFKVYNILQNARADKTMEYTNGIKGDAEICDALVVGSVVRYQLNDNEEIKRVQITDTGSGSGQSKLYANDTGLRLLKSGNSFHYYNNMYATSFGTNTNTKFFIIPTEENWLNEEEFSAKTVTFQNDRDIKYYYEAYTFGKKDLPIADVMVIKGGSAATVKTNDYMFVLNKIRGVIENGEEMFSLSGISKGKSVSFLSADNPKTKYNVEEGDILIVHTKADGTVADIIKVFTPNKLNDSDAYIRPGVNDFNLGMTATRATGAYVYVYATVTGVTGEGISFEYIEPGTGNTVERFGFLSGTTFARYNINETDIEAVAGSVYDIVIGDKVLILTNYAKPNQIVVFKNR
ncbi:MAG: hypothetical protein IKA17_02630 [Clostridia bacterium]|nr:hypothetical protein [Clostridia bacterium]